MSPLSEAVAKPDEAPKEQPKQEDKPEANKAVPLGSVEAVQPPAPKRSVAEDAAVAEAKKLEAEGAAVEAIAHNPKGFKIYVTAQKENSAFAIRAGGQTIQGRRDKSGEYILFRVPEDMVAKFEAHTFCKGGRIIKAS